jgi:transposase
MFALSSTNRFHLYIWPTDMRRSFDGLSGLIQNNLASNPCNGDVYIFVNKGRDKIKLLHWQGVSFTLYYKRLEKGTFEIPEYDKSVDSITLSYAQIVMIVDGLSIKNIQRRKAYQPENQPVKMV